MWNLSAAEYMAYSNRLQEDRNLFSFVLDKVRLDYIASRGEFTIRMTTTTYEHLTVSLAEDFRSQLQRIGEGSFKRADIARQI